MKLWSQFRPGVFWIEPADYGPPDRLGRREKIAEGLKVEFTTLGGMGAGSLLDTVEAQQRFGWSDERREMVEAYLVGLPEFGFTLFHADEALQAGVRVGSSCQVRTLVQGGVRACGRPVQAEGQMCEVHARQAELPPAAPDALDIAVPPRPDVGAAV